MTDSRHITPFVFAHLTQDGQWTICDHFRNETSVTTYPTFDEARKRYRHGEVPMASNS